MSLSGKGALASDRKLTVTKLTALNPNAAEFVPSSLKPLSGSTNTAEASSKFVTSATTTYGKAVLDRPESSASNNSDDEAHQYWRHQLPDDITPDFKVTGDDASQGINSLSFTSLSLADINEAPRFSASPRSGFMFKDQQELSSHRSNGNSFTEKLRYPVSSFPKDVSSGSLLNVSAKPWDKHILNSEQLLSNGGDGSPYNGNSRQGFVTDMISEQQYLESSDVNPLEFLAAQFPGFAAESLTEVYFANGGDLNLTIDMLTQLELQVDGGMNRNFNSKAFSAPNLNAMDFPALSTAEVHNGTPKFSGDDVQQNINPYRSSEKENLLMFKSGSSFPSGGGARDFASAVRKMAPQESSVWNYDRNGFVDANVGSSRSSHILASSYNSGQVRGNYGDRLQSRGSARATPTWLETGEAVANMYTEMREEARDHARLRNAYFEQARQAYLIGNKALAKELSAKGQLHNMHMKEAHGKAQESIYRQRNPEIRGNGRGQERIIDLHGLHVTEALHVLKRELAVLRNAARSADQRLQVYICVGTGHHTRGARTPARLPVAVQRYLLEEEGLDYSEPQPGLLRVVIY